MIGSVTGFPCPAFCEDHIVIGLKKIPCVIGVTPCATADETVAYAVVHFTSKTIGIRTVVGIVIAVMMRVAVNDVIIGAIGTVVLTDAGERIGELMSETELDAGIEVIGELAALYAVVGAFQFDGIVGSVHDMQAEENPVIAGNE